MRHWLAGVYVWLGLSGLLNYQAIAQGTLPSLERGAMDTMRYPVVSPENDSILFDFRWASELHNVLDAQEQGDQVELATRVAAWNEVREGITDQDNLERQRLIQLLTQDRQSSERTLDQWLDAPDVSWSMLLALEQVDTRRGQPSANVRAKIENLLRTRCEVVIAGYLRDSFFRSELSRHVCQTAARLSDPVLAVDLLKRAGLAIERRGQVVDLAILSLQTDRLTALAQQDPHVYHQSALRSNRALCQHLAMDSEFLRSYPLALAKAYCSLATLEQDGAKRLEVLAKAVEASEQASFDDKFVPQRWYWEAGRITKQAVRKSWLEKVELFFQFQKEQLRSSALLTGYRVLAAQASPTINFDRYKFDLQEVASALKKLDLIQQQLDIDVRRRLTVLVNRAAIARLAKDPDYSLVIDRGMAIAWPLRRQPFEDREFEQLVLDCQTQWITSRVDLQGKSTSQSDGPMLLPEIKQAIEELKSNRRLTEYPELARRLDQAELVYLLAGDQLDQIESHINKLFQAYSADGDQAHLVLALKLLLAVRTGDWLQADELTCTLTSQLDLIPARGKLLPYYALAELEIERGFRNLAGGVTIDYVLRLHEVLEQIGQQAIGDVASDEIYHLRLENALQLASAKANLNHVAGSNDKDANRLEKALRKVTSQFGSGSDQLEYRRVWQHIATLEANLPESLRLRASVCLAADLLREFKEHLNQESSLQNQTLLDEYLKAHASLKVKDIELRQQLGDLKALRRSALRLSERKGQSKSEFDKLARDYDDQAARHDALRREVDLIHQRLLNTYGQLFQKSLTPAAAEELAHQLQDSIALVHRSLKAVDDAQSYLNIRFNARCLILESAILMGPDQTGTGLKELNRFAQELAKDAMRIRSRWRQLNDTTTFADRDRLFDRYQLGFELAVRWLAQQGDFREALRLAALTTNRSLAELKGEADSAQVALPRYFIAYFSGNDALHVFWSFGSDTIEHVESGVNRTTLNQAVGKLLGKYRDFNQEVDPELERLMAGWLLPTQLSRDLLAIDTTTTRPCIYCAPHGPLFQLPLEALQVMGAEQPTLGQLHPLIYVPTLVPSSESPLAAEANQATEARYLTIQPSIGIGEESLKFQSHLNGTIRLGPGQCTEKAVTKELANGIWEIVHFGTHATAAPSTAGSVDSVASIELDRELLDVNEPEVLDANELVGLSLSARHVFLSACETQAAHISDLQTGGNTLNTLGTTFLVMGADDVIASHWKVRNVATTELFGSLIEKYAQTRQNQPLTTEELAKLLFAARSEIRTRYEHPYYWNAFTIWTMPEPDARADLAPPALKP